MVESILIREVGLRDGLQLIKTHLNTAKKQKWLKAQIESGFKEIEIASIVPKKTFPQFADASEMIDFSNKFSGGTFTVLVPNLKGAVIAFKAKAKKIIFVVSASEAHNLANVRMTVEQSLTQLKKIISTKNSSYETNKIEIIGSISTSFGCSISGSVSQIKVLKIIEKMLELGVNEISIADTVGYANPRSVTELFNRITKISQKIPLIGHFHDTHGFGLANLVAAVDQGVKKFDSSLRGLGGCPYAPGASGNIATEDCVHILESMGYDTGIDLTKLISLCTEIENWLPSEKLHGKLTSAIPQSFN